jgi:hypothetical protein
VVIATVNIPTRSALWPVALNKPAVIVTAKIVKQVGRREEATIMF